MVMDAYRAGMAAREAGKSAWDNPYGLSCDYQAYASWQSGYYHQDALMRQYERLDELTAPPREGEGEG